MDYLMCFFLQFAKSGGNRRISPVWSRVPLVPPTKGQRARFWKNGTDLDTVGIGPPLSSLSLQKEDTGPIQKISFSLSTGRHVPSL